MKSIVYPTTECPDYSLYPIPKRSDKAVTTYVKVGCRHCSLCDDERLKQKQDKWVNRIREMILHYQECGDRVVFLTMTLSNQDLFDQGFIHRPDLPKGTVLNLSDEDTKAVFQLLKDRLSRMFNSMRMVLKPKYGKVVVKRLKYWNVMELGGDTKRPHAHVFLFLPKEIVYAPLWDWIKTYWRERFGAYILHSRLVNSAMLASWYASKYACKQIGWKYDRQSGSQFGWEKFMEEVKKKWLSLPEGSVGATSWVAVRLKVDSVERAVVRGDVLDALRGLVDADVEIVCRVDVDRPVLHPFGGCFIDNHKWRKYKCNLEKLNPAVCEQLTIMHSLVWVPDTPRSLPLLQQRLEKLSREVEQLLNL